MAQHQFLSKYQSEQQIADYVVALRSDIGDCEFICSCKKSIADTFLRAQFIRGIQDNSIRERLLQCEIVTFNEIVTKAIALETLKIDSKELAKKTATSTSSTDVNKITKHVKKNDYQQKNRNRSQQRLSKNQTKEKGQSKSKINYSELGIEGLCLRCGRNNHLTKDCRTDRSNLKCSGCDKSGHIIKVCIRSLLNKKFKQDQISTKQVQDETTYNQYNV